MARVFRTDFGPTSSCVEIDLPVLERAANLVLCIDVSGSMDGAPIKQINGVIRDKFERTQQSFEVFAYDNQVRKTTTAEIAGTPLRGGGGTDFSAPLEAVAEFLKQKRTSTTVVFMTDGQDNQPNSPRLQQAMSNLKLVCSLMKGRPVTINVIGFGASVDAAFLERIRVLGNREGVFVYAAQTSELGSEFDRIFDHAVSERGVSVKIGDRTFDLVSNDSTLRFLTEHVLPDGAPVSVRVDGASEATQTVLTALDPVRAIHRVRAVDLLLPETEEAVKDVLERLERLAPDGTDAAERAEVERMKEAIKERMMRHIQLFARFKEEGASAEIRMLTQALRFEARMGGAARDKLDKRVNKNVSDNAFFIKNDPAKMLKDYKATMDEQAWADIKRQSPDWVCLVSTDDLLQLMRKTDDDFLCVGVEVRREPSAVQSPTRGLELRRLTNSVLSFNSFVRAAAAHKQNSPQAPFDMVGTTPTERFNAVIPLYINPHHMKRARILEGVWLGHLFTQDPFGYDKEQEVGLVRLFYDVIRQPPDAQSGETYTSRRKAIVAEFEALCGYLVRESEGLRTAYGQTTLARLLAGDVHARGDARDLEVHLMVGILTPSVDPKELFLAIYYDHVRRQVRKSRKSMGKASPFNWEALQRLMYGTGEQRVTVAPKAAVADNADDPDYLEKSFAAFFIDERRVPIPLIPERNTAETRRVIADADVDLLRKLAPPVPAFVKDVLRFRQLPEDLVEQSINPSRLQTELALAMAFDNLPPETNLANALSLVDRKIQGDPDGAITYDLTPENVALVVDKIVNAKTLEGFAGLLRKYAPRRCEPLLHEAVERILAGHGVLGREKLEALLTNRAGFAVLYGDRAGVAFDDICWIPWPEIDMDTVRGFVGADRLRQIEEQHITSGKMRLHRYRPKLVNRHGHGNHNPFMRMLHRFDGYK